VTAASSQTNVKPEEPPIVVSIEPFDAALGAEIRGVDLSRPVDGADFALIEQAYYDYSVLLFRDQRITPEQQIALSRRFGELQIHVLGQWRHPQHAEILIISNVKESERHVGVYNAGRYWHADLSYMQSPSRGSLLYAIEIPQGSDHPLGDTLFSSVTAAYDALPDATKNRIRHLRAAFSLAHHRAKLMADGDTTEAALTEEQLANTPTAVHRIVQAHPVTGCKCLFVNEGHTVEILDFPAAEAGELLAELCAHCTRPEFVYRHHWRIGDLLMWDNIATQHLAVFDYLQEQRRYMHRTTLAGVELD